MQHFMDACRLSSSSPHIWIVTPIPGWHDRTPLHDAAQQDHLDVVKYIL